MKIYISGPMSGLPEYNYPTFELAEKFLMEKDFQVISPHRAPKMATWAEYMRYDIKLLCDCDVICMLPGWEASQGATLEWSIAAQLNLAVWELKLTSNEKFQLVTTL